MDENSGWDKKTSPYHSGEQELHERLGKKERQEAIARKFHRPFMTEQHRAFYNQLPFMILGSVDKEGWPWASIIFGKPGFVTTPSIRQMVINAKPIPGDPLTANLSVGSPISVLGIEPPTRRRNRMNGVVRARTDQHMEFTVVQAYGNCPQYIQTREIEFLRDPSLNVSSDIETFDTYDRELAEFIRYADTFFVSSHNPKDDIFDTGGVDVNHRGGLPGFIKVDGDVLTIPDYRGNFAFNTLGNFLIDPKAGLLFVDFDSGDVLMMIGSVELVWEKTEEVEAMPGADRAWRFKLERGVRLKSACPIKWEFGEYSPVLNRFLGKS